MAKRYIIECSNPWFTLIKQGIKPVEGRKANSKWNSIKKGDIITFTDGKDGKFDALVTDVNPYHSPNALQKYLEAETLARALPGITTIEEGMKIYHTWSTPEEIEETGFLGIQVKVIHPNA